MTNKKRKILGTATAVAALMTAHNASAQSMDYGSLEMLFGEPVTTSAIGVPQRATEVPVTMEIITADEIRRSAASDLSGVLKYRGGVEVWQHSLGSADVSVRGYNQGGTNRLLVLVNGRQVYLDHFGLVSWNSIPVELNEIRQIEIVKGPNTALFGFNAVGGVVNIVTYNPLLDDVDRASATGGTQANQQGSFVGSFKLNDKIGVRVSGGIADADHFDNAPAAELAGLVDHERRSLSVDSLIQLTDKSQLGVELTSSSLDTVDLLPTMRLTAMDYATQSGRVKLLSDTGIGRVEADLYTNILDLTIPSIGLQIDNQVTVAKLQNVFKIGSKHNMRLSAEYRHNAMDTSGGAGGEVSFDVFSLGGMWNWPINEKFSLTNAVRVDNLKLDREGGTLAAIPFTNSQYDADLLEVSVNSGLVWKPDDTNTIRLSYARGIGAPSLIDFGFQIVSGPVTLGGSPFIDSTVVTNYEAAWERPVTAINGKFRSAIFYQESEDVKGVAVNTVVSPAGVAVVADNIGDSELWGLELGFSGRINQHWNWRADYTFETIDDSLRNRNAAGTIVVAKEFEDTNPEHTVNAQIGYARDKWELDLFGSYVSSSDRLRNQAAPPVNFLEPVGDYITVSGRAAYKIDDQLTLALQGQDFITDEQRQNAAQKVERRVLLTLSADF